MLVKPAARAVGEEAGEGLITLEVNGSEDLDCEEKAMDTRMFERPVKVQSTDGEFWRPSIRANG